MLFAVAVVAKILWIEGTWGWILVGLAAVVEIGESYAWYAWSKRRRARVGVEVLVGATAVVLTPCRPEGQVRVHGEIWRAVCREGAEPEEKVVVERVDGLTLEVRRA